MSILGIGVDVVALDRIAELCAQRSAQFAARIFTANEQRHFQPQPDIARIAARFAVKEAVAKALGTGIGQVGWQDILNDLPDLLKSLWDAWNVREGDRHLSRDLLLLHMGMDAAPGDGGVDGLQGEAVPADPHQRSQGFPHPRRRVRYRPPGQQGDDTLKPPAHRLRQRALPPQLRQPGVHPVQRPALDIQLPAVEGGLQIIEPQRGQQLPQISPVAHCIASTVRVPSTGSWSGSKDRSSGGAVSS